LPLNRLSPTIMSGMAKEYEIFIRIDLTYVAFVKGIIEAADGLAFMRVENKEKRIVRFITTEDFHGRLKNMLRALRRKIPFEFVDRSEVYDE